MHSARVDVRVSPRGEPYRIRDATSAAAAAGLPRGAVVRLEVRGMDSRVAARHEFSINSALSECGCRLSAAFLVVTVCAAAVVDVLQWSFIRQAPVAAMATELVVAFIASGIGRIAGIARARRALAKTLSAVGDQINGQMAKGGSWAA
jgi:hypothetical protein